MKKKWNRIVIIYKILILLMRMKKFKMFYRMNNNKIIIESNLEGLYREKIEIQINFMSIFYIKFLEVYLYILVYLFYYWKNI